MVTRASGVLVFAVAALAGCSAEIAPGSYFCGPELNCPEGLACNGVDNICVLASQATPFSCEAPDPQGDDVPTAGQLIDGLACVSPVHESRGCLTKADPGDWYQFDIPDNCVAVQVEARVTFPTAFEPVALELSTDDGPGTRVETPCRTPGPDDAGEQTRCFQMTVENGAHHAIGIVHEGDLDCGGGCANNRYILQIQLSTP